MMLDVSTKYVVVEEALRQPRQRHRPVGSTERERTERASSASSPPTPSSSIFPPPSPHLHPILSSLLLFFLGEFCFKVAFG